MRDPWKIDVNKTGINELANKPRYDLDGQRYGNTLSDDMISLKNPREKNRHAPESYEYFNDPVVNEFETMAPAFGWESIGVGKIPTLDQNFNSVLRKAMPKDYRDNVVGRVKNVSGNGSGVHLYDEYEDWSLLDDVLEFPDSYTPEQVAWAEDQLSRQENAQKIYDLGTEGLREDMRGEKGFQYQSPRREAEWDPYIGDYVDYGAMSPKTMEMLAKMGVKRPQTTDDLSLRLEENGNDTYNTLLGLYRMALENGWLK